jgi:hypothetical protein
MFSYLERNRGHSIWRVFGRRQCAPGRGYPISQKASFAGVVPGPAVIACRRRARRLDSLRLVDLPGKALQSLLATYSHFLRLWLAGFLAELLEEGIIVWAWPPFSLAPLVTTFYPNVTLTQSIYAFVGCTVVGLIAAVIPWRLRPSRHEPGDSETEDLAEVRCVTAGDRYDLAGRRVGSKVHGSLEALLYLPHPAKVDQEPAVDPQEALVLELLLEMIEAADRGLQASPIAGQPDIVVVRLCEADLAGVEQYPSALPRGDNPARQRLGAAGADQRFT